MSRISQRVLGMSRVSSVVISDSDASKLEPLLEGITTIFQPFASGGTDAPLPAVLHPLKLGVSRKLDHLSCTVNVKHVNPAVNLEQLFADKAMFDANFTSTLAATGIRVILA